MSESRPRSPRRGPAARGSARSGRVRDGAGATGRRPAGWRSRPGCRGVCEVGGGGGWRDRGEGRGPGEGARVRGKGSVLRQVARSDGRGRAGVGTRRAEGARASESAPCARASQGKACGTRLSHERPRHAPTIARATPPRAPAPRPARALRTARRRLGRRCPAGACAGGPRTPRRRAPDRAAERGPRGPPRSREAPRGARVRPRRSVRTHGRVGCGAGPSMWRRVRPWSLICRSS